MAGGCIVQRVDENLTYDYLHSSEDNLWSTLYLTGYLTKAREEDYKGELPDGMVALMIPKQKSKRFLKQQSSNGSMTVRRSGIEMLCLMQSGTVTAKALPRK